MKGRSPLRSSHPIKACVQKHYACFLLLSFTKFDESGYVNGCDLWVCQLKLLPLPFLSQKVQSFIVLPRYKGEQMHSSTVTTFPFWDKNTLNGGRWSGIWRNWKPAWDRHYGMNNCTTDRDASRNSYTDNAGESVKGKDECCLSKWVIHQYMC